MRKLLIPLLLLFATTVSAQTASVPTNTLYSVTAVVDGVNVVGQAGAGYRCYVDGVKVGADLAASAPVANVITCANPAITTLGTHTVQVSAFNTTSEVKSVLLTFTTTLGLPTAPGTLHIIVNGVVVAADGTMTPVQMAFDIPLPVRP